MAVLPRLGKYLLRNDDFHIDKSKILDFYFPTYIQYIYMYMLSFKPEFSSSKNLLPLFFMVFLEVWLHPKLEKTHKVSQGKISFLRSFSRNAILRLFRIHSVLVLNLKHTQSLSYFVSFFSQALKKSVNYSKLKVVKEWNMKFP